MAQQNPQVPLGAIHCISGLTYLVLEEGKGKERPGPEDIVRVVITSNFNGTKDQQNNIDIQTLFLNETGAGLSEAFQLMTPKQKIRVWIPASLQKKLPKGNESDLVVYDLELVDFKRTKKPPFIPDHLISPRNDE